MKFGYIIFFSVVCIFLLFAACAEKKNGSGSAPETLTNAITGTLFEIVTKAPETECVEPYDSAAETVLNRDDTFIENEITINNNTADFEISEELREQFFALLEDSKFNASFYVIDIKSRMSIGYNANVKYNTASTVKAGYALYCFKEIEAGRAGYNDLKKYEQKHYIKGSGSTQNSEYGTIFTIKVLLYRMLYNSDNVAYYMLLDHFGYDGYNEMMKEIGVNAFISSKDKWGQFTAQELGLIWQAIYGYKDKCGEGRLLWEYLTGNLYNEIQEELKEYATVAHKSGWSPKACHDSGIVMSERPYIIVLLTDASYKMANFYKMIRWIDNVMKSYSNGSAQ